MNTTKLIPATLTVQNAYAYTPGSFESAGFKFSFIDYPGLNWFVGRTSSGKYWQCWEETTRKKAGDTFAGTRRAAIQKQFDALENMRGAKNHNGSHASVIAFVEKCIRFDAGERAKSA